jgi:alpha-L-rhamnosidase
MNYLSAILLTGLVLAAVSCNVVRESEMNVTDLKCEYLNDPLGIGEAHPRLSWVLESAVRGQSQSAYQVLVSSSRGNLDKDIGDLWDTGKITGDQTTQIAYAGKALTSRQQCFWKVKSWDAGDQQTSFSQPALWTMGLLAKEDWQAQWIGRQAEKVSGGDDLPPGPPVPYLRKNFNLAKPVKRATAYVTARGLFELYLNGRKVSNELFSPGWTDYTTRIQYCTYDVTGQVAEGENAVGALVADGWYSGYLAWSKQRAHYGYQNSLLCQLEIEYEDGSLETVVSDNSWRSQPSPITAADFLHGENYDARLEASGWATSGFDDTGWEPALIVEPAEAALVSSPSQPVRVTQNIEPVAITEPREGVYVFDMGQNFAGWVRLKVNGEAGSKVTLRFVERLNPDGSIYTTNIRAAKATDTYVLKGGGEEIFEPRFTFHGFQYVEVQGYPGTPSKEAITGCVMHSDMPLAGQFECSDLRVNKLWTNSLWSQRGNFISIPTDCPQRDERLGWMGDAQIFIRTASLNMDAAAFFSKWMVDVEDAQTSDGAYADVSPQVPWFFETNWENGKPGFIAAPGWGDAGVIVPWTVYRVYGDTRIIKKHFASMELWMDYIHEANPDLIRKNKVYNNYGDWLSIGADTPKDLLATAYWAYDAMLMSRMAAVIGNESDSRKYDQLFQDIRAAFLKAYVSPDGSMEADTQTAYLLALFMDLLPEQLRPEAAEHLVDNIRRHDWHLTTGFLGVRQLNPVLTSMGYADVAYRLLNNDTFPSWLYPIKNGATTIWERWDGWTEEKGFQDPGMNSFNHYSLGSVSEWLYRYVAGIDLDPEIPGYSEFVIRPYPGGSLTFARAEYESIHGTIASGWTLDGDSLALEIKIPANTRARVFVPSSDIGSVSEGGMDPAGADGVTPVDYQDGYAQYLVESGSYRFTSVIAN